MSTHTKVNELVYSEYDCTLKDCSHDECPTERVDICQECSQTYKAWPTYETTLESPESDWEPFAKQEGENDG